MQFALSQFLAVFQTRDESGQPHIIIGGQAVNYWAETLLPAEPELARFLPFVSKDIDFLGNRADVLRAARQLGGARFPLKKMSQLDLDWRQVLPEREITASLHRMIVRFHTQRLPQWWEKIRTQRPAAKK